MDDQTFIRFQSLIYEQSGIFLKEGKKALVEARIGNRLRALGLSDPKEYLKYVGADASGDEVVSLLDAISTNVTFFFREDDHFTFLRNVMERIVAESKFQSIRIWSAASSTGEEPYSIAMVLAEVLKGRSMDCKILATDISTRVLKEAMEGRYAASRIEKVPADYLKKYFVKAASGNLSYTVRDDIRKMVTFSRINLSETPFPMSGPFDFVFCRNVMIYFDTAVRTKLITEITRLLRPGGFLMVGHSETLAQLGVGLKSIKPSIYRKVSE